MLLMHRAAIAKALIAALTCACAGGAARQEPQAGPAEPASIQRAVAPPPGPYAPGFDALHYDVSLEIPDAGPIIRGRATVAVALRAPRASTLALDLTGLAVDDVSVQGRAVTFAYDAGKLRVPIPSAARVGDTVNVEVRYHGQPDDGLIIQKNVHGNRTAFADNWPDRARFWFPCIDHPSDKATVAFTVTAPSNWVVLANGTSLSRSLEAEAMPHPAKSGGGRSEWRWRTREPIPTYTMVIGAAEFRTGPPARSCVAEKCVDVTWWSFPEDAASMEPLFRRAGAMLDYFARTVAPFEYEKLAHVQSSTMFGGMENASVIFYSEKAIAEGKASEQTVAHETAHQWFGDSVTEHDWHDLWLSEGFATYFAALFYQHADGEASFRTIMEENRQTYLESGAAMAPVVDPLERNLLALLNPNNYEKGAWVLHMLRGLVGDRAFFEGIRAFYRRHRHGNATTADFRAAIETSSRRRLEWFFRQWLYEPGHPMLRSTSDWNAERHELSVTIEQVQNERWPTFRLPLVIQISGPTPSHHSVELRSRRQVFRFRTSHAPTGIEIDPDGHLLKELLE